MSGGGKPGLHQRPSGNQQQGKGKQQQQQQGSAMLPPKMPKKRQSGKRPASLPVLIGCGLCALVVVLGFQWYMTALPEPGATLTRPPKKAAKVKRDIFGVPETKRELKANPKKRESLEWTTLPRDYDGCLEQQQELMTIPVPWPGFHAICIDSVSASSLGVALHNRSGDATRSVESGTRLLHVAAEAEDDLVGSLVGRLREELLHLEFQRVDPMVSTSDYDFPPNPWRIFTQVGNPVESGADLQDLGRGAMLYLYTGGQFIWPGVRIGHVTRVPIPVTDGSPGGHKVVEMTTASLRPLVLVLSDFLTEEECSFIRGYAMSRMQPSGLAMMDSSGSAVDVRTSTQTFMERSGSPQIRALEERAHNLTRLPYELGENIQVVRYMPGQKYGAHRDFFNPNDYRKQPQMLSSVEYGGRNRLATVFWYLATIKKGGGGETFFPRALNAEGREYNPWNGDHEDCYRGTYVQPVRGNAVLFYSMVPDGRLDERSLHGGCKPKGDGIEKWGANQWIWNHPNRHRGTFPRRGAKPVPRKPGARPGCEDSDENCAAWAESGECEKNAQYMKQACCASCG